MNKETAEEVLKAIELLQAEENTGNSIILVEGKKDKKAIERLGLKNILCVNNANCSLSGLFGFVEGIDRNIKEAAILTDLDKEGKRIYHKLKQLLQARRIKINDKLRNALFKTELRQIEGLYNYLEPFQY